MARDYEDIHDIEDLDDDELRQLVREHLAANNFVDVDDIAVRVRDGVVYLNGRVGSEGEQRVAERLITDLLGVETVENELVVDPLRRAESPMDVDDHLASEEAHEGLLLGDVPRQDSDEVLQARGDEDPEERAVGTTDVQDAIAHGTAYIPPTSPTQEGFSGTDAGENAYGEDH
jgi:BON domain-containing protein